jgi:Dyp-type peroxidase family
VEDEVIDVNSTLDTSLPEAQDFLNSIQGNIVKGHGRDFTSHILVKMTGQADNVRSWISKFAADHVTSAGETRRQATTWKVSQDAGDPFSMFLLSPDGFRYLGFTDSQLPTAQGPSAVPRDNEYFRRGMKQQATIGRHYQDPPSSEWEEPYRGAIDAMVLLADDDKARLDQRTSDVLASFGMLFDLLCVERGQALRLEFPQRGPLVVEHFGFQDGVSQPIMIKQDLDKEVAFRGGVHWNPEAPLNLALSEYRGGYGSFMVFRKLEQNVRAFRETLDRAAVATGLTAEEAGAMAVGRHQDGTPLVPTTTTTAGADPNDFHYDQDPVGAVCPFHAHIRKTNPRGDIPRYIPGGTMDFERARRIVRRGITYGNRPDLTGGTGGLPETGVGLLFMCFQANLDQFVIQQEGSDGDDFVVSGVGRDAAIGQGASSIPQTWPSTGTAKFTMSNMVKMLGGEYLFAPSMSFLKNPSPLA